MANVLARGRMQALPELDDAQADGIQLRIQANAQRGALNERTEAAYLASFAQFASFVRRIVNVGENQERLGWRTNGVDAVVDFDSQLPQKINWFLDHKYHNDHLAFTSVEAMHSGIKHVYESVKMCGRDSYTQRRYAQDENEEIPPARDAEGNLLRAFIGNPAFHPEVLGMMDALKRNSRDYIPNHATPLTYDDMGRITEWCDRSPHDSSMLEFNAMCAIAFYCWLRYDEIKNLTIGDVELDQTTLHEGVIYRFHAITLNFRKTNQHDRELGYRYEIHDIPGEPNLSAFTKLDRWIRHYKAALHQARHALNIDDFLDDDPLFPRITAGGAIDPGAKMHDQAFKGLLDRVVEEMDFNRFNQSK